MVFCNGFLSEKARKDEVPCRFCRGKDGNGHLFWECTYPLVLDLGSSLSSRLSWLMIVVNGCLVRHGCLSGLSLAGERDPWPPSLSHLADRAVERCLGAYPSDDSAIWTPPDFWDAGDLAQEIEDRPSVWTDGSREDYPVGGFEVAGAGVYLPEPCGWPSGVLQKNMVMPGWSAAVLLCQFLVHFRLTVQRAEFWGAILALLACWPCHLGIDNLNVVRSTGRLLDHGSCLNLCLWLKMGILLLLFSILFMLGVWVRLGSPRSKVMPLRLMWIRDWFGLRIGSVMLRRTVLLIWVGVISLRLLWMRDGPCSMLGKSGTL